MPLSHARQRPFASRPAPLPRQALLARAANLARAGSFEAALALLRGAVALQEPDIATLDLMARIRVQQGAWLEAERLWFAVLKLDPSNRAAIAALARLHRVQRPFFWIAPAIGVIAAIALLLAAISGGGGG